MAWAVWLAVPIGATILAALFTWWRGRRAARAEQLDTAGSMQAHQSYLDSLVIPARSDKRPTSVFAPSGTVTVGAVIAHDTDGRAE